MHWASRNGEMRVQKRSVYVSNVEVMDKKSNSVLLRQCLAEKPKNFVPTGHWPRGVKFRSTIDLCESILRVTVVIVKSVKLSCAL